MIDGFRDWGHSIDIVSPDHWARGGEESPRDGDSPGWRKLFYRIISRYAPELVFELLELLYNGKALWSLWKSHRASSCQALYERYSLFGIAGVIAARRLGVPIVVEINYLASSPLFRKRTRALDPVARRMERFLLRRATGFVAVSSTLVRELIASGVPEARIRLTPNAADPCLFDPDVPGACGSRSRFRIRDGGIVIGFVGGFYPWHSVPRLVEAVVPLMRERDDLYLMLVGEGPDKDVAASIAMKSGVSDRVILTGSVPHPELPTVLSCMDLGVMPNSNDYGSPMKVFEYMAMGIPVIAPRLPPLADVIRDGENGILFSPGNLVEMREKIARLMRDDDLRRTMGRKARRDIIETHNWKANAGKALELLSRGGVDATPRNPPA
ncbi:glycosyltransferase family 4 protein [Candidatus Poribacteria bacterium]|nr:glycosyltransferase family 4 protein [Candidatus Poribacteria bacterium]